MITKYCDASHSSAAAATKLRYIYLGLPACARSQSSITAYKQRVVVALEQTHQPFGKRAESFFKCVWRYRQAMRRRRGRKTCGQCGHLARNSVNKVVVDGLFIEQKLQCAMSEKPRLVLKVGATHALERERWVELSLVFLCTIESFFYPHTFSNLDECSLYGSAKEAWQGRAHPGTEGGEKMRSRVLARPLPEPAPRCCGTICQRPCAFSGKKIGRARPLHLWLLQLSLIFCPPCGWPPS